MKVLVLTSKFIWPLNDGGVIRDFNLLRETAKRHEVYLLSFLINQTDRDYFSALKPYCKKIIGVDLRRPKWLALKNAVLGTIGSRPFILREYFQGDMAETIEKVITEENIDVIHAHFLHMGQYITKKKLASLVYDPHNLEHILWKRLSENLENSLKRTFAKLQCQKLIHWQQIVAANSEVCVTLSDKDRDEYLRIAPYADITTVPNGVDIEFWSPIPNKDEPYSIIYFGNLSWLPQADAAIYFYDKIFPHVLANVPEVKLYIVGQNPPESVKKLASDRIIVTGFVEDIRQYIARTAVVVMPLRIGAGTKHRIFQALAMKKSIVATSVAAEGIALKHGETVMLADEAEVFAKHTITLLRKPELRKKLGHAGWKLVHEQYNWVKIYEILDSVFRRAVEKRCSNLSPSFGLKEI